jgi:hypothetical protein
MDDHHNFQPGEWPFADAVNTGVYATVQVMNGAPILELAHDDDGDWQFLHSTTLTDDDAGDLKYVCLGCVFERHRYIAEHAQLQYGWAVMRNDESSGWVGSKIPYEPNDG